MLATVSPTGELWVQWVILLTFVFRDKIMARNKWRSLFGLMVAEGESIMMERKALKQITVQKASSW